MQHPQSTPRQLLDEVNTACFLGYSDGFFDGAGDISASAEFPNLDVEGFEDLVASLNDTENPAMIESDDDWLLTLQLQSIPQALIPEGAKTDPPECITQIALECDDVDGARNTPGPRPNRRKNDAPSALPVNDVDLVELSLKDIDLRLANADQRKLARQRRKTLQNRASALRFKACPAPESRADSQLVVRLQAENATLRNINSLLQTRLAQLDPVFVEQLLNVCQLSQAA